MTLEAVSIGIIGCGHISGVYLQNAAKFDVLRTAAVADLLPRRARDKAKEFSVPAACSPEELLARDDVEVVVNLTPPAAHEQVNLSALAAGKHVYSEKPLAISREGARKVLDAARSAGLRVACAPDTPLGAGLQTCRKLIDDGAIGRPIAAMAYMLSRGPDAWHPDPEFFHKPGAGPMFDMGPYYLTALTTLIAPAARVCGSARVLITPRTVGSGPKKGRPIDVETPDHVAGTIDFGNGAVGTVVMSFALEVGYVPHVEVYGSGGSMVVSDPNTFGGPVKLFDAKSGKWQPVPLTHRQYGEGNLRALGVADLACAIRSGRPHRCTGEQAYHVIDLMHAFLETAREGTYYDVPSVFDRPAPLPADLPPWQLDA
jgi:predicted dehydrogenase